MIMMPSCLYFILSTRLSLNMWTYLSLWLPLEDRRGLSLGRPFCIMLLYRYLLHYGLLLHIMSQYLCLFSLILQGLHEEGECRQPDFGLEKEQNIRDLFCATPKVLKLHESQFWNILKILGEESTRGGSPTVHQGGGAPYSPGCAPLPHGPHRSPLMPIFWYKVSFALEKIRRKLSGRTAATVGVKTSGSRVGGPELCV